ncbi:MAG: FAD-dependent oxidoreductase [Halanaerobiaceae bacterium]
MKNTLITLIIVTLILVTYCFIPGMKSLAASAQEENYSLTVYSGEPEGVMAAVAAARAGIDTLLIMEREEPGGLMTYGGLNYLDLNYGPKGELIRGNLFAEWHEKVGGNTTFSIKQAQKTFNELISAEDNLKVYRNSRLKEVVTEKNIIKSITIKGKHKARTIKSKRFIDASQDADLAVMSGVPYFVGGADIGAPGRIMSVTQILKIGNVNYQKFKKDIAENNYGPTIVTEDLVYGLVKIGELYNPVHKNVRLRGLNIVLEGESNLKTAYINALLINDVDPLSSVSLYEARLIARNESQSIMDFFKKNLGGFENAKLLNFPPELYIRESRHIKSRYQLQPEDQFKNKIFRDTIAIASYPLDYQSYSPQNSGFVLFNPLFYGIPFRSLIPVNINNLLVVGRSSGYSSLAAASTRVLPTGMFTAEAAGIAAALSLENDLMFNSVVKKNKIIDALKERLDIEKKIPGIKIPGIKLPLLQIDSKLEPYFNLLLNWGIITGGYSNDFKLNHKISERSFVNLLIEGLKRRKAPIFHEWVPGSLTTLSSDDYLDGNKACQLLLAAASHRVLEMKEEKYYKLCLEKEFIPKSFKYDFTGRNILTRREAYILVGHFLSQYSVPEKIKKYRGE